MKITLRFFAILRDKAGVASATLDLPATATVSQASEVIATAYPALREYLARVAYAINREYASPQSPLSDGDELALIPPVSGGYDEAIVASPSATIPPPPSYEQFLGEHRKRVDAFDAFGDAQSAYFDQLLAGDRRSCLFCGKPNPNAIAELQWTGNIVTAKSAVRGGGIALLTALITGAFGTAHAATHGVYEQHEFFTRHATCKHCFLTWRQWGRIMKFLHALAIAAMLIGGLVAVMFLMLGYGGDMKPSEVTLMLQYGWGGVFVALAGVLLYLFARERTAPAPLRHLLVEKGQAGRAKLIKVSPGMRQ